MSKNIKTIPTSEYDAVIATATKYIDGLRVGSVQGVLDAFHGSATMYGFISPPKPEMLEGPISNLGTFIKENGAAPDIKARLDVLGITPTTAVVKVDMENDASGAEYTDFLTMIKIKGQWQTIAKVFHKYGSA